MSGLREQLVICLPPVTLLLGPPHSGKKTFAAQLVLEHARYAIDQMWVRRLDSITAERIRHRALLAPAGPLAVVTVELDGAAPGPLNSLLKTLEEPPETARFILLASADPLPTIKSRSQVVYFGLTDTTVLTEEEQRARSAALGAIKAAHIADSAQLGAALRDWDAQASKMLTRWCQEKLSGCWRVFDPADSSADRAFAQRLLTGLAANRAARPRLAARTALEAASRTER